MIDIGVNLTNHRFEQDCDAVLARARAVGIEHCIVTGTSIAESEQAVALCRHWHNSFPGMLYCTAGIHPHGADSFDSQAREALAQLIAQNPNRVVAVGETGLDFNRNFSSPANQERAFEAHIELAAATSLPLFLHERDAFSRQYAILRAHRAAFSDAVIHCFTGDRDCLFAYLDLGLYIGITGWICDERRGLELQSLVGAIPGDRLMLETDAPYLVPRTLRPKPRNNRNEPAFLTEVLKTVADCRGEDEAALARATADNARRFFRL